MNTTRTLQASLLALTLTAAGLTGAHAQNRGNDPDMRALRGEVEQLTRSVDKLTQRIEQVGRQVEQQSKDVDALRKLFEKQSRDLSIKGGKIQGN